MKPPVDIAALREDPSRAASVPAEAIPTVLATIATDRLRDDALERVLLARLLHPSANGNGGADRLLTVDDAATMLATTPDWLRRHGARLGLAVPLSPGQVRYSTRAIERFIAAHVGK